MSHGASYGGGRTHAGTKVFINVYDLSPANDYLYHLGIGLHHSGVEVLGTEYSFASNAGIFEGPPKFAPGAQFREQIDMGSFAGGQAELKRAISELRDDFPGDEYNLIRKNCNHFANALCWKLLGKKAPGHINRLSEIGSCCSCLLPRQMLENAPVGDDKNAGSGGGGAGYSVRPGTMSRGTPTNGTRAPSAAFTGKGARLGGSSSASSSSSGGLEMRNLLSGWTSSSGSNKKNDDDPMDRREKARKSALARLEQKKQDVTQPGAASTQ